VLGVVQILRGRMSALPMDGAAIRLYLVIGLTGISLPHIASFTGTTHLPAGIMAIILSMIPLFALPMALVMGREKPEARRLAGVGAGLGAMVLLMGAPGSLPNPGDWLWVLIGMCAPLLYAIEGASVSGLGARHVGPFQALWAGSVVALGVAFALVLITGVDLWPVATIGRAEAGFVVAGLAGILSYAGYLALLRVTGPVFGAQVSYVVTAMGVIWSMTLLGERYPWSVWAALVLLFAGLALVRPRPVQAREPAG
jgi:drug/metabolite transporter (DMT)-like permease